MTVTKADADPAAGDILTTNGPGPGQFGPLIYSPQGRLVWFGRLAGGKTAENLSVQSYEGRRALTWWKGRVLSLGFGQGEDVVMDSRYRTIAPCAAATACPPTCTTSSSRRTASPTSPPTTRSAVTSRHGRRDAGGVDRRHGDRAGQLAAPAWCAGSGTASTTSAPKSPKSKRPRGTDAVGLLPPQLDRPAARRQRAHLGAQHLGRLPAAGRHRQGALAPGRQQELLQDGPGHEDGLAARRTHAGRRRAELLRRRRQPADPPPVAGAAHQARPQQAHGDARGRLHPQQPAAARGESGQRPTTAKRQHAGRLRRRAGDQRVRRRRHAAVRRPPAL